MRGEHDDLVAGTNMRELYERLEVRVLDVVEPGPQEIRLEVTPTRSGPARQLVSLGQLYRVSAALAVAISAGR